MIAQLVGLVFKAIANTNIDETKAGNQRYAMWHRTSFQNKVLAYGKPQKDYNFFWGGEVGSLRPTW